MEPRTVLALVTGVIVVVVAGVALVALALRRLPPLDDPNGRMDGDD